MSSDDEERSAHSTLRAIGAELAQPELTVDTLVRQGQPAEQILDELARVPTEMIVMRTHGRVGIERALLGSVAEQILTRTSVPLLLTRPGERRVAGIEKLLVPVDGSPGGAVALRAAIALARGTGASIKLVQVAVPFSMQMAIAYEYGGMGYFDPAWNRETLTSASTYVEGLARRLRSQGLTVEGEAVMSASPVKGICGTAEQESIDLVVMSTHALTGPMRAVLGSVADAVVRTVACPVLLVRRTRAATEKHHEPATQFADMEAQAVT